MIRKLKQFSLLINRLIASKKLLNVFIGVAIIVVSLFFLEGALQKVGVITSSIATSYLYNLFADAKKELDSELTRIEQEEMIR